MSIQIRAIMLQHAEDCKRMSHADAGRLAMAALQSIRREGAAEEGAAARAGRGSGIMDHSGALQAV